VRTLGNITSKYESAYTLRSIICFDYHVHLRLDISALFRGRVCRHLMRSPIVTVLYVSVETKARALWQLLWNDTVLRFVVKAYENLRRGGPVALSDTTSQWFEYWELEIG
jgi:hypothetical protein